MFRKIKEGFLVFTTSMLAGMPKVPSMRGRAWAVFQDHVATHIEGYAVKQYGDYPNDRATRYTAEFCVDQIGKYADRFGKGQRGTENEEMDLLKIAHYASMAFLIKHYNVPDLMEQLRDGPPMRTSAGSPGESRVGEDKEPGEQE
ncbi:MAG: hypothetical protein LLG06_04165 [Desulfobacteraceae bacterium]|nr:hypothetical protein [Desulfobacteraceae bacterium]